MEERSLRDLFHMVKRALPDQQELVTVTADMEVRQALERMSKANINQVPVIAGNVILGVFSYRSLAKGIINLPKKQPFQLSLPVELFIEDLAYAGLSDEIAKLVDEFDTRDAVLVGSENQLLGILTTIDALRYFYSVASPYVLLREIELSIRELIRVSISNEELSFCIDRCLKKHYEKRQQSLPTSLEEMTFNDYVMLLRFDGNWQFFKDAWGGTSITVAAKLEPLPTLRNEVFHFKRDLTIEEYDILRDRRDWLLKRIRKADADRKVGKND
jgi:CBS domain-containing protein